MSEHTADPICGHCDKPLSQHHEGYDDGAIRVFCYLHTNGDWFSDEPDADALVEILEEERPEVYEEMFYLWRVRNGHEPAQSTPGPATELLPCPFCGGEAEPGLSIVVDCEVGITCAGCGASVTDHDGNEDEARAAWNRRNA